MVLNKFPKTSVLEVYHKILPRNNITHILNNSSINEVICFIAPYGCGKTAAGISWLREHNRQVNWLNLNEDDNEESGMVADLIAAVLSSGKDEFLTDPMLLDNPQALLQEALIRETGDGREKILVITNFHLINNITVLRLVKNFISICLGHWHVFISSRADLPAVFNDLVLKGNIRLITSKELNFSLRETADFFIMNGCDICEETAVQIHAATEGWPAALNAILTACRGGQVKYGEAAREYIRTFFEEEIWNGLNSDTQNFLLKTSVLEELTLSSCHAVTGIGAVLPVLKWLTANGLFTNKQEEENTYRYHIVFRDFLLKKLSESKIDEAELYSKAAWWFFERGDLIQSFPYFFKANDYYGINQVLKILNAAELGIEAYLEMAGCIIALNIEDLKSYPILVFRIALIHFLMGNIEEMQRLSAITTEWYNSGELSITSDEYGEYVWEAGWLNYIDPAVSTKQNSEHEEWSNYSEYVPHIKPTHYQRHAVLGLPSAISGLRDYCCVVDTVDMFLKYNEETGYSMVRQDYALYQTELISGEYAYQTENYERAEERARKVMLEAESKLHIDLYFVCTSLLVKVMRATGDVKEIESLINRLEMIIVKNNHHFLLPNFHAFQLRNKLLDGQRGFTEVFLTENEQYKDTPKYYLVYRHIAYIRGLMSLENYREAMLLIGGLEKICTKYNRTMDFIEINVLKAIALYGLGYEEQACDCLVETIKKAEEYNFLRVFSDEAIAVWPILEGVKKRYNNKYVQNIIVSCKKTLFSIGYKLSNTKYSHIELTKTEIKILKSLQIGMSYTEISLDSNITISTVKSHIHSIYSKLEVNNKTSAVIEARKQGIIE